MILNRRWLTGVALVAGCLLIGVSWALNDYLFADFYGDFKSVALTLKGQLAWELVYWIVWACLAPVIFWITRRVPIEREHWIRSVAINIFAGALLAVGHRAIYLFIAWLLYVAPYDPIESIFRLYRYLLFFNLPTGLMSYAAILLVSHMLGYYQRFQEEELKASRLKTELAEARLRIAEAQLQALKMQLQPHFLFNTLNSISALLEEDVEAADEMIARLGDFLRMTLDNSGAQEVSLQQELEFLRAYLEIERVRFQDRLTVSLQVDPGSLEARVPNLILQPIVENAIKHGIVRRIGPGLIEIRAENHDGALQLRVTDNGPGLESDGPGDVAVKEGLGLSNTRARLEQLYGTRQRFVLSRAIGGGLQVIMEIPFQSGLAARGQTEASAL
ncbi:MAG TPA: histidine kinase [Blastocatellia bacterium]|jgi:sensor histidine kinase YesM|nr:histidine kinase [Blastocatellia bacterium]